MEAFDKTGTILRQVVCIYGTIHLILKSHLSQHGGFDDPATILRQVICNHHDETVWSLYFEGRARGWQFDVTTFPYLRHGK